MRKSEPPSCRMSSSRDVMLRLLCILSATSSREATGKEPTPDACPVEGGGEGELGGRPFAAAFRTRALARFSQDHGGPARRHDLGLFPHPKVGEDDEVTPRSRSAPPQTPPRTLAFLRSSGAETGGSGPASLAGTIVSSDFSSTSDHGMEDEAESEEAWRNQDGLDDMSRYRESDFAWSEDDHSPPVDEGPHGAESTLEEGGGRTRALTELYLNALATTPGVYRVGSHGDGDAGSSSADADGEGQDVTGTTSSAASSSASAEMNVNPPSADFEDTTRGDLSVIMVPEDHNRASCGISPPPSSSSSSSATGSSSSSSGAATGPPSRSACPTAPTSPNDALWLAGLDEERGRRVSAGLEAGRRLDHHLQARQWNRW